MGNRTISTMFAKVSINRNLFSRPINELVDAMVKALKQPTQKYSQKIKGKEYVWVLASGTEYEYPEGKMIYGRIIKTSPESILLWDFESEKEIENLAPNYLKGLCHYLFYPEREFIVFRVNPNIPVKQMMQAFAKLCEINSIELGSIEVKPFLRDKDLIKAIGDIRVLTRVKFKLIPSNPDFTPEIEAMEAALNRTGSRQTVLELNGPQLNYKDTLVEQATMKVISGQGEAIYTGRDEINNEKVISSTDYSLKTKKEVPFSEEGILNGLYSEMKTRIENP